MIGRIQVGLEPLNPPAASSYANQIIIETVAAWSSRSLLCNMHTGTSIIAQFASVCHTCI